MRGALHDCFQFSIGLNSENFGAFKVFLEQ